MKLNAFHCDINTKSTFLELKRIKDYNLQYFYFHLQLIQKYMSTLMFSMYRYLIEYAKIYVN
jgi:hypothetical protein